ncbi:MAG TPA: hypothetical protein VKR60_05580 [Candidatus Sulfotelmatobacter sp.]|nr:hypothetical protein [Candidatus Sulfotelmatobacter sp.]
MTLTILIMVVAVLVLALSVGVAATRALQASGAPKPGSILEEKSRAKAGATPDAHLQPLDVEAFRNLVDPAEDEYLRRHLSPAQFRVTQRARLRARAAYVRVAARNAAVLIRIGQTALDSNDARVREAALQLVNDALLLRRNATFALLRIYAEMAWPGRSTATARVIERYERLSGSAMLLGRLRNPVVPVRLTTGPE